jgi:hypothetical protein
MRLYNKSSKGGAGTVFANSSHALFLTIKWSESYAVCLPLPDSVVNFVFCLVECNLALIPGAVFVFGKCVNSFAL